MYTAFTDYEDFLVLFAQFIGFGEMPGIAEFLLRILVKAWLNYGQRNDCKAVGKNNVAIMLYHQ